MFILWFRIYDIPVEKSMLGAGTFRSKDKNIVIAELGKRFPLASF
jgi:hypothetical protein